MLGTPPAFILSQDQTLNYSLFNPVRLLALPSFFPFTVLGFVSEISISCGFTHFSFRIFRVALLFSFQCSVLLCFQQLLQYITTTYPCQYLFWIFLHSKIVLKQRRRRDLNPRAAINDLLPFQGSPFSLLGISPRAGCTTQCLSNLPSSMISLFLI